MQRPDPSIKPLPETQEQDTQGHLARWHTPEYEPPSGSRYYRISYELAKLPGESAAALSAEIREMEMYYLSQREKWRTFAIAFLISILWSLSMITLWLSLSR